VSGTHPRMEAIITSTSKPSAMLHGLNLTFI
jgi:hypothetical protein